VFEGFFEFRVNPPAKFFVIRPEKDHLFSLGDFLDFVTSGDRRDDGMRSLFDLRDGIVYNFTPVGDARELAFLHADSSRFVVAGFTMVRRDDQLHWAMIGGPICDLAEKTRELRSNPYELKDKPPEKAFIDVDPSLEFRAEPLAGTDDVWKSIVFGRFNLRTEKHEVRAFGRDHGNHYFMNIDDPETFAIRDPNSLSQRERELLDGMIERIENENVLFEIAVTCFQLPAYFAFRITLVRETKKVTVIAALSAVQRSQISSVDPEKRPLFRTVAALELVDIGRLPAIRSYTPPQYKVEVNGFWRKLEPESVGKDVLGNPIKGRTWIKGHLRWRDRPERRQSTMFVKSSIASARAKASAIIASDPTAVVIGDELPPIFPTEIEPDNESTGWLYVMRCPLMDDDVYKVGWSSRAPKDRAEEISKATGVPMAYIVVESWKVEDARRMEAAVHQALTTFRINPRREFFKAPFENIRAEIIGVLSV
jgi:T5orf172 domain